MNKKYVGIGVLIIGLVIPIYGAETSVNKPLAASVEANHRNLLSRLSTDQIKLVSDKYSDFRLLKICSGRFSGGDKDELVLGVWKPLTWSKENFHREFQHHDGKQWRWDVHRIGLLWNGKNWVFHDIDEEMSKEVAAGLNPQSWQYTMNEKGFNGEMKCGIESEFKEDSDLTYALGDKPLFDLDKKMKPVCFATDDVYNNWDCLVYDAKADRFRLWYQQAHAD